MPISYCVICGEQIFSHFAGRAVIYDHRLHGSTQGEKGWAHATCANGKAIINGKIVDVKKA